MLLRDYLQNRDIKQNRVNYSIQELVDEVGVTMNTTEQLHFYKHIKKNLLMRSDHQLGGQHISTRRARDIICSWLNED